MYKLKKKKKYENYINFCTKAFLLRNFHSVTKIMLFPRFQSSAKLITFSTGIV